MKILLSNDDGYQAEGLNVLAAVLSEKHEIYICAPFRQMSSTGHAVNIFKPLEIHTVSENIYALDGTPADCVKVALDGFFSNIKFDMVISGINDGPNLGDDIFYSGTVAAAREGSLNGLFSIACSRDGWGLKDNYLNPARFILRLLDHLSPEIIQINTILNVNFPQKGECREFQMTSLAKRVYTNEIKYFSQNGKSYLQIEGDPPYSVLTPGSDMEAILNGLVSITPLANMEHDQDLTMRLLSCLQEMK